jgi:hypothetical protein
LYWMYWYSLQFSPSPLCASITWTKLLDTKASPHPLIFDL